MFELFTQRRCRQVAKVLQSYLDGELDPITAHRVHEHLEECRRCGLDARTYQAIKAAIPVAHTGVHTVDVDPQAVERLRSFAQALGSGEHDEPGPDAG